MSMRLLRANVLDDTIFSDLNILKLFLQPIANSFCTPLRINQSIHTSEARTTLWSDEIMLHDYAHYNIPFQ